MNNDLGTSPASELGSTPAQPVSRVLLLPRYPVRSLVAQLAFLAFVVARYIQLGARRDILATVRFEFLLGIAVIIIVSTQLSSRKPALGRSQPIIVMIGLLFVAMVLQIPFAAAPITARKVFMDRVIKFAFLTYFMVVMIESPKTMKYFLAAFLFSTFYVTLEATQGLISGGLVWENQGIMRLHGAVPIYAHPNSLAGAAMGSLPFVAFLVPHTKRWLWRLAMLATVSTSMVCVIYSGSRTAYVGLIAFILWWWFQSRRKWRFLIWLLILGTVFVSVVPAEYIGRFESITGHEKEGHSREARLQIISDALVILQENPLGVGVASFPAVRAARFGRIQDTHNLYLEVATNLGYQGLVVFLILVGVVMSSLRQSMQSLQNQLHQISRSGPRLRRSPALRRRVKGHYQDIEYLLGVAKATGGFILIRLVLGFFGMDLYEVYWWFGAGLAISLSGLTVTTARNTRAFMAEVANMPEKPQATRHR